MVLGKFMPGEGHGACENAWLNPVEGERVRLLSFFTYFLRLVELY